MITLEQLNHFLSAAKYLSFSKAAAEQYKHSTTISKSILSMENELGTPLFIRENRTLKLTQTGQLLYDEGQQLVRKFDEIMKKVQRMSNGLSGTIVLLSPYPYSYISMAGVYNEFCQMYPDIDWEIISKNEAQTYTIMDPDIRDRVDLAICTRGDVEIDHQEMEGVLLNREPFYLYVAAGHPLYGRSSVRLAELANLNFLLSNRMRHIGILKADEELKHRCGLGLRGKNAPVYNASLEAYVLRMGSGKYASLATQGLFENSGKTFSRIPIDDFDLYQELILYWRKDNPNPSLKLFTELAMERYEHLD